LLLDHLAEHILQLSLLGLELLVHLTRRLCTHNDSRSAVNTTAATTATTKEEAGLAGEEEEGGGDGYIATR
jgi:hypothetical protein